MTGNARHLRDGNIRNLNAAAAFNYMHAVLGEDADIAATILATVAEHGTATWHGDEHQPIRFTVTRSHMDGSTIFTFTEPCEVPHDTQA